ARARKMWRRADAPLINRNLASLRRRGPDTVGFWANADISLGHARLSIIGLDERGTQLIENDRHVVAYSGAIYNFDEIRRKLLACGVPPQGCRPHRGCPARVD